MDARLKMAQKNNKFSPCSWKIIVLYSSLETVLFKFKKTVRVQLEYNYYHLDCSLERTKHHQLLHSRSLILWVRFWKIWILSLQSQHLQRNRKLFLSITWRLLWTIPSKSQKGSRRTVKLCSQSQAWWIWQKLWGFRLFRRWKRNSLKR